MLPLRSKRGRDRRSCKIVATNPTLPSSSPSSSAPHTLSPVTPHHLHTLTFTKLEGLCSCSGCDRRVGICHLSVFQGSLYSACTHTYTHTHTHTHTHTQLYAIPWLNARMEHSERMNEISTQLRELQTSLDTTGILCIIHYIQRHERTVYIHVCIICILYMYIERFQNMLQKMYYFQFQDYLRLLQQFR